MEYYYIVKWSMEWMYVYTKMLNNEKKMISQPDCTCNITFETKKNEYKSAA